MAATSEWSQRPDAPERDEFEIAMAFVEPARWIDAVTGG
jgi:hypothetical protein